MKNELDIQRKLVDLKNKLKDHLEAHKNVRVPDSRYYTIKYQLLDEIRTLEWVLEMKEKT